MSRKARSSARGLPIRVRRIIARDGGEAALATVFCPMQAKSLKLSDCKVCQRYVRTQPDDTPGDSSLICSHQTAGPVSAPVGTKSVSGATKAIPAKALSASVAAVMTRNVVCVRPDLRVDDLVLLLVEHGISGVPVVNDAGKPVGVVSRADLLWESYDETEARTERIRGHPLNGEESAGAKSAITVEEIMTPTAVTLPESASIAEGAAVMARHGVHRAPIVDQDGLLVGILSTGDLVVWLARAAGQPAPKRFPRRK
jgi:CBS domain-containing protein